MEEHRRYKRLPDKNFIGIFQLGGLVAIGKVKDVGYFYPTSVDPLVAKTNPRYRGRVRRGVLREKDSLKVYMAKQIESYITLGEFADYLMTGYAYAFFNELDMLAVYDHYVAYLTAREYTEPTIAISINQMDNVGFIDDRIPYIDAFCVEVSNYKNGLSLGIREANKQAEMLQNQNFRSQIPQIDIIEHTNKKEDEEDVIVIRPSTYQNQYLRHSSLKVQRTNDVTLAAYKNQDGIVRLSQKRSYQSIYNKDKT